MVLICISLMAYNVNLTSFQVLVIFIFSSVKCLFMSIAHFLFGYFSLVVRVLRVLYVF